MEEPTQIDYDRPVAYDAEGRPLYAHPHTEQVANNTNNSSQNNNNLHPADRQRATVSDATRLKHDRSKKIFPDLDLNEGDYVISAVRRHPIGLLMPSILGVVLISFAFLLLFNYDLIAKALQLSGDMTSPYTILLPVIIFVILVVLGEYVAYYVYTNNRFFLTNESVIQEIQNGLFSRTEQIVSLGNIEDASYTQSGITQQVLNYGSIRLSTEGEETTYRFSYVSNPKEHIAVINNAIENFKSFRPNC
jgi:hypothetical protein